MMPPPQWVPRATPFCFALTTALNSLYKAELIRNQGPWQDVDAARARHRRVGPLGGHHSPSLRYRYAYPRRPRSRLGPQYQPEQLGTITIGNHPHQIYQPPQNPGLDTHQGVTSQVRRQEQDHAHSGWPCPGPSGEHQQGNGFTKCT